MIDIQSMQKEIIPYMESEMDLLSKSDNKNVIKLFKSHQTAKKLFLVLEVFHKNNLVLLLRCRIYG